jgi:hypothetical protein
MIGLVILWIAAALAVGAVGTLAVFRWSARVWGQRLHDLIISEGTQRASLCRVVRGGGFLDHDRLR